MRFVMWLVESRDILAATAANYVGAVQGWHLRRTGGKLAAGMRLARVAEMVKGLRRLRGAPGRRVRRGVSPDVLRALPLGVLQKEKRALQGKLRLFARDFEERKGRKVKYHRDIRGMAGEYARYKQLKSALTAAKAAAAAGGQPAP